MTTTDGGAASEKARGGIADTIAGKTKEVVGAALGNDSLASEGQLQQSRAHATRESAAQDAVADAATAEAQQELREAREQAADEHRDRQVRTAEEVQETRTDLVREQADAERTGAVEEEVGQSVAEDRARGRLQQAAEEEQADFASAQAKESAAEREYQAAANQADAEAEIAEQLRGRS